MDMSRRALQTNGKSFSNFEFVFECLAENRNFFKKYRVMNICQIAMCYISMDLSQRALQTNEKLIFKFKFIQI